MARTAARTALLTTCLPCIALLALARDASAFADSDYAVCRSYDLASRTTVHSNPVPYAIIEDEATDMRQLAAGFHAASRSRFGLRDSAQSFCNLFSSESEAQAFIDKDRREAASSNMAVRESDEFGESEGIELALERMAFWKMAELGIKDKERASKPMPRSRVLPAHAGLLAPTGKRWQVLAEGTGGINVIGLDPGQANSQQRTAVVANYLLSNQKVHVRGGDSYFADYSLQLTTFDCSTRGKAKVLATYLHSLEHGLMASDTREQDWVVSISLFGQDRTWKLACGQEEGEAFAAARSHDETTRAYRPRAVERKRLEREEAEAEYLALRTANVVPQTSLAAATASPHWHVALKGRLLSIVDAHGVTDGSAPGRKRLSNAVFFHQPTIPHSILDLKTEVGLMDFAVQDLEFDCATPGRVRQLAYATYGLLRGKIEVIESFKGLEEWKDLRDFLPNAKAWAWACREVQETDPLPAGMSFETLLKIHRDQVRAASGQK